MHEYYQAYLTLNQQVIFSDSISYSIWIFSYFSLLTSSNIKTVKVFYNGGCLQFVFPLGIDDAIKEVCFLNNVLLLIIYNFS